MTETELAELLGTIVPTLKAAIQAIYKSGIMKEYETKRCVRLPNGNHADAYNLEMIAALAFRLNSRQAAIIRQWLLRKGNDTEPINRSDYYRVRNSVQHLLTDNGQVLLPVVIFVSPQVYRLVHTNSTTYQPTTKCIFCPMFRDFNQYDSTTINH